MADPRAYDTPVAVAFEEALAALLGLAAPVEDVAESFAARYGNPHLLGSPLALLEAAAQDEQIRAEHGPRIVLRALVGVIAELQERVAELERAQRPAKPAARKR
jgi:hypothetical protein